MTVRTSLAGQRILAPPMRVGMARTPAAAGVGGPANYAEKKFYFCCKDRLNSICDLGFGRTRRKHPHLFRKRFHPKPIVWGRLSAAVPRHCY